MGTFWDQVVNFVQPSDRAAAQQGAVALLGPASVAPQRYPPNASLEAIGMQNETLRSQIEEVEHGFEHLDQVKGLFHGLLSPMSELLAEFEATKARLHEARIKLTFVEDAHEGLSARHAAALEERDIVSEARNALLRENREMAQRAQRVDAALSETQIELRECSATKDKLERLLDVETRLTGGQGDEIRRLKDELSGKDKNLASLELSLKVASDQGLLLSQENATLRDSSQGLSSSLDAASRRIAEYESRVVDYESLVDQGKHRIAALEQALSEEQAAHASLRAKHLELAERSRAEMATLNNTVHAVRGRVEVTNKILDQARGQLREKIEELRAAERRLLENGIQIDGLEKSARSQKEDLAAANERIAGTERMRGALVDQVNSLTDTVRAKDAALQTATRTIEQLTARLEEMASGRQRAKEELERRTATLQDEIARMRAERQLTDGALEASRAERQQARRASPTIGDAQREATAASSAAEPSEAPAPQQTNVTKLPRTASL
jgi:chromosome segregation ATPase